MKNLDTLITELEQFTHVMTTLSGSLDEHSFIIMDSATKYLNRIIEDLDKINDLPEARNLEEAIQKKEEQAILDNLGKK